MKKKQNKYPDKFKPRDKYEEWLIKAIENDEFVPVPQKEQKEQLKRLQVYAANYLRKQKKEKRVTIRVDKNDLARVQGKALKSGLPYQTLINALIHQYAEGNIKITL